MKDAVSPSLFELLSGGVHSVAGGGEGARGQHFNMLSVADRGTCIDNFLPGFEEFLGKLPELKNFSFDERVAQSSHCAVN